MTFRSISQSLAFKLQHLAQERKEDDRAQKIARDFFREEYDNDLTGRCQVSYDRQQFHLTLIANTKTLANDLLLRSGDLGSYFRSKGLPVKQIIVR